MSERNGSGGDPDPGIPIAELGDYAMPTSDSFVEAVRKRLDARERELQTAEFALIGLGEVFCSYFFLFLQMFTRDNRTRE